MIVFAVVGILAVIILVLNKRNSRLTNSDNNKQDEIAPDGIDVSKTDKVIKEDSKNLIYRDTLIYKEKIIYKDTVVYKTSPPKTIYQDKIVYRDKPEPYHEYGKGKGKLLIYTTCTNGYIEVWVDGVYWGQLIEHYYDSPNCGQTEYTLYKTVLTGSHHIRAKNTSTGGSWDFHIDLQEDECYPLGLKCKQ